MSGLCECGCGRKTRVCDKTYARKGQVKGQPFRYINGHTGGRRVTDPQDRFWPRVNKDGPLWNGTPCWEWLGRIDRGGYGGFKADGYRWMGAHVFAYENLVGPVPAGLVIDHLCRNRRCVNPDHMEPVIFAENILRGTGPTAVNKRKTHCIRGHEFTPENTYIHKKYGGRMCRECHRERGRVSWKRRVMEVSQ